MFKKVHIQVINQLLTYTNMKRQQNLVTNERNVDLFRANSISEAKTKTDAQNNCTYRYSTQKCVRTLEQVSSITKEVVCWIRAHGRSEGMFARLNDSVLECREIRHVKDNKQEHLRNNTGTEAQPDNRPCFFT